MIPFLFAIHSHQPVGNFGWVFEQGVKDSYQPFLELLARHPKIKVAIHYSGCLLEWIEEHRPDHVELLKELVSRGQVEILGGGFYEPILPIIPERDARAQILSYADHLEALFGTRPRGLWLTERVWDPRLPELFEDLGVDFTLVDESHFRYGGVGREDAHGPFLTESRGKSTIIFPIDKQLRYVIPFREPRETINYVKERASKAPGYVACYGDDGEKFGMWPGTHEWVFEKGWLERFFTALEEASDEIQTMHFAEYLANAAPRARVYLPPASYEEMMEWTLPPHLNQRLEDFKHELQDHGRYDDLAPFVRGGHWDMFLAKYEESNRMHKRMILASDRIAALGASAPPEAVSSLYRSQCNCAYWHGVFGGLYLNYLRHAVYEQVLTAEELAGVNRALTTEFKDYDLDGVPDALVSSADVNAILSPGQGGSLVSLEYPRKRFCVSNLMSRREEAYHRKLFDLAAKQSGDAPATIHDEMGAKEEGLEKRLFRDRFQRNCLQDHITPRDVTLTAIEEELVESLGEFAGAPYELESMEGGTLRVSRESACGDGRARIAKEVVFTDGRAGLSARYRARNTGAVELAARLGVEFNLTLLAGDAPDRYYLIDGAKPEDELMRGRGEHDSVSTLALVDEAFGFSMTIKTSAPAKVFRFPVETISQSESGYERNYQGCAIWLTWPLELAPGEEFTITLEFDFADL